MFRKSLILIALFALACGVEVEHTDSDVTVRSQVVLDGLSEVVARSSGEVTIDEVLLHSPQAQIVEGDTLFELLQGEGLIFSYDLFDEDAKASGDERTWPLRSCSEDSTLVFDFSSLSKTHLASLKESSDYDELLGKTLVIKGRVFVPRLEAPLVKQSEELQDETHVRGQAQNQKASGDPDTMPTSGDPDTMPTSGDPDTMPTSGDPDTMPTAGDPDTMPTSGDPDTMPTSGDPDTMPTSGDPDTMPTSGDPDTMPTAGDPDTMPTQKDDERLEEEEASPSLFADQETLKKSKVRGQSDEGVWMPFTIHFDGSFSVEVPLQTLSFEADETQIELHVDIAALFKGDRLNEVKESVTKGNSHFDVSENDLHIVIDQGVARTDRTKSSENSLLQDVSEARR